MRILITILIFFVYTSTAQAENISNVFGVSVFGVEWTDNLEQVKIKYPDGKVEGRKGDRRYVVDDARDLMGLSFNKENKITYVFNQNILTHIDISFSEKRNKKFDQITDALVSAFGNAQVTQPIASVVMLKWPEDEGVTLSVVKEFGVFGGSLHLNIQNTSISSKRHSKKSLGFD